MIILYKDPNGESLKDTITGTHTFTNHSSSQKMKSDWEQKVAILEKKVLEQEEIIDKMKGETGQKVS